jgi:hypothetical protein
LRGHGGRVGITADLRGCAGGRPRLGGTGVLDETVAESLIEMNTRARLRIDHNTLTPDWYGDRLDPEPVLDALLPRPIKTAA